tara:strand:- start:66551 stop:67216 length:666 start_codon:yes stop_codon:yes gene_type:complete
MQISTRRLLLLLPAILVSACAGQAPVAYHTEKFDTTDIYSRRFPVTPAAACEAVNRTLLSQGYIVNTANATQVDGHKSFQPANDVHVEIAFRVVCTNDSSSGQMRSTVFVTALEDRYAVKKINNSASVGVGALGSLSLPFSFSDDSMVRVASETIETEKFYARFFQLVERYLGRTAIPATQMFLPALDPESAKKEETPTVSSPVPDQEQKQDQEQESKPTP